MDGAGAGKNALLDFANALLSRDDFVILTHKRPDGDALGSAAALCAGLRKLGKRAYLFENPGITKRLSKYFAGYFAPEGYEYGTVISVDTASPGQLSPGTEGLADRIDFLLDHHISSSLPARVSRLVDTSAAATGEIVFDLISAAGAAPDKEIATALYISIATDTGCFKYNNTGAKTHRIAAALIEAGADNGGLNTEFFEMKTFARIELERHVYTNLRFLHGGRIAAIYISLALKRETGVEDDDIEDLSSLPRQIEGVAAGITAYEQPDGSLKISLRTTPEADAAAVCAAFGGGGHPRAAGCTMHTDFDGAVALLEAEIKKRLL